MLSPEFEGNVKSPNYALVIFDFDGTLCDSYGQVISALNEIHESYGFRKIQDQEVQTLRDFELKETLHRLGIGTLKLPFVVRKIRKILAPRIESMRSFDGVSQAINDLNSRHVNMGVLTSNSLENVNAFLKSQSIKFDFVYAGSSLFGKARLLTKLKREVSKDVPLIYVGDETRDIEAAQAAGFQSVAVTWGYNSKKALERVKPDFIVDDFSTLETLLREQTEVHK